MTGPGGGPASNRPWVWAKELPAERHARLTALGLLVLGGVMLTVGLAIGGPGGPRAVLIPLSIVSLVFGALLAVLRISGAVSPNEWARLLWMDYRECPSCRETLDGLADEGNCPKCGQGYDPTWLKNVWTTRYPVPEFADVQKAVEERGLIEGRGPTRAFRATHPERRRLGVLAVAAVLVFIGMCVWLGNSTAGALLRLPVSWVMGASIGLFVRTFLTDTSATARAVAFGFRVCPACRFDLRGLPDAGVCPECRSRFTLKQLRATWVVKVQKKMDLESLREAYFKRHPEEASVIASPQPSEETRAP